MDGAFRGVEKSKGMAGTDDDGRRARGIGRRELFKRGGALGAVVALPLGAAAPAPEQLQALSAAEADALNAIAARLIPADATGPGATEARVGRYIDRALAGDNKALAPVFSAGLAAVDELAVARHGAPFAALPPELQDPILTEMEADTATGFGESSALFFGIVRELVLQGMFCDPEQGGNEGFAGWDLLGYYGVRLEYTARQQQLDVTVRPAHMSAADYDLFNPRSRAAEHDHGH
jgi:gluconate 2-dehydrogenase gamma chain